MKWTLSSFALMAALVAHSADAFSPGKPLSSLTRFSSKTALQVTKKDLLGAQEMVDSILQEKNCGPVMVRLAWHDSGTYDAELAKEVEWPLAGGATGSICFDDPDTPKNEIEHGANAGLQGAVDLLEPVKQKYPDCSYADIFQMASARAIELAGGPKIDMKYGRLDADLCNPEGNLPDAEPNPDTGLYGGPGGTGHPTEDKTPMGHLRKVFYRMGINDEEIVALSGAHTFGRAYKDRSGLGKEQTKFTNGSKQTKADGSDAKYTPGGSSWTERWLVFDNSYFTTIPDESVDEELLKLSTDKTLFDDEGFKEFAEKFRDSQEAFFESYKKAHKKLSELGSKFEPEEGIKL